VASEASAGSPEPQLGIFWHVPHQGSFIFIADSISLSEGESYGDCLTYPLGHHDVWEGWRRLGRAEFIQRQLPIAVITHEYEEFPRGRVVYETTNHQFIIYADRKILTAEKIDPIIERFNLAGRAWSLRTDLHYRT
jgi:hypothetical protein